MENWQSELQTSVLRGVNRGRAPGLIGPDQVALIRNASIRGGRIRSRSRWVRRTSLPDGLPQGLAVFGHADEVIVSTGGRITRVNTSTFTPAFLDSSTDRNWPYARYAYFCETEQSLVIQDGRNYPWVYDAASFKRSSTSDGVPIGTTMAYGNGRLAVAIGRGRRRVRLGDIRRNTQHQSELKFTEWVNFQGGGDFTFHDRVLAMTHLPVVDSATGFGSMLIGTRQRMFSMHTEVTARNSWDSTPRFVGDLFNSHGIAGHAAHAQVNQDVYFRSHDGIRSLRATVADYSSAGSTPISREVAYRTDYDTEWMLEGVSFAYWDNRLFVTHSPYLIDSRRPIFRGLLSLNFDLVSEMGAKAPAAYDGEWDGPHIVQIAAGKIRGENRLFALCVEGGVNTLWELLPERKWRLKDPQDRWPEDSPTKVVETRVFYGADPRQLKAFRQLRLWISELRGFVHLNVKFRAEGATEWTDLDDFKFNAAPATSLTSPVEPQSREDIRTRTVEDTIDTARQRSVNIGHGFQFRFEWSGDCRIDYWEVLTEPKPPTPYADNFREASGVDDMTAPTAALPDEPAASLVFRVSGSEVTEHDFGTTDADTDVTVDVEVYNSGDAWAYVDDVSVDGEDFSITTAISRTVIPPRGSATLTLTFSAQAGGLRIGSLDVEYNGELISLGLRGFSNSYTYSLTWKTGSTLLVTGTVTFTPESSENTWSLSYSLEYHPTGGTAAPRIFVGPISSVLYQTAQINLSASNPTATGTITGIEIESGGNRQVSLQFYQDEGDLPEWFDPEA